MFICNVLIGFIKNLIVGTESTWENIQLINNYPNIFVAKLNHVSEQTLRLYDKMDLLKPIHVNENTGYRYYSIGQSATLDMIQYYKEIGIPLTEIHHRLNEMNINSMPSVLQDRYEQIEKELIQLKINQATIQRSLNNFNRYLTMPQTGQIFLEYIPERQICIYKTNANFFAYSYYEYEYHLRMFKDYLRDNHFPISYFSNVGTLMRHEHFAKKFPSFYSDEIFVFVDQMPNIPIKTEVIPGGTYISMCCSVFNEEKHYLKQLLNKIEQDHLEPLGDYICEVIAEYPNSENGQREIFYKIQIRIK